MFDDVETFFQQTRRTEGKETFKEGENRMFGWRQIERERKPVKSFIEREEDVHENKEIGRKGENKLLNRKRERKKEREIKKEDERDWERKKM